MKKLQNSKIFFGILVIIVVFFGLLAFPKIAKFIAEPFRAQAVDRDTIYQNENIGGGNTSSSTSNVIPSIQSLSLNSGPVGTYVTINGAGFDSNNYILFSDRVFGDSVLSNDGATLAFFVPNETFTPCNLFTGNDVCPQDIQEVSPGAYSISVVNVNGKSGNLNFNVTEGHASTLPTPIFLCTGGNNCIQGAKFPQDVPEVSTQRVRLDGGSSTSSFSYVFDNLSSGLHTISVTAPQDWYVGYTLCINSVNCHDDLPIQGDSVTINFRTNSASPSESNGLISVPAGSYIDLYWHFSQNFDNFGGAPTDLNNNTGEGTTPSLTSAGSAQADAYTSGNNGNGSGAASGLAGAAKNALGCALSQILNGAIRSALSSLSKTSISDPTAVPITHGGPGSSRDDIGILKTNQGAQTTAHTGVTGFGGGLTSPSLDAIAYCLQNAILQYINQATMQWINTAFNGNPAFVQNLGQFVMGLSDQAVLSFFNNIRGVNSKSPFQGNVDQSVLRSYGSNFAQQSNYTLGNNFSPGGDKNFVSPGGFAAANQGGSSDAYGPISSTKSNWGNFYDLTQNPANHPSGQTLIETAAVNDIGSKTMEEAKLSYIANNGYVNTTKPNPPVSGATNVPGRAGLGPAGSGVFAGANVGATARLNGRPVSDPGKAQTTQTGGDIRDTGMKAKGLFFDRAALQSKFDQFLTQMINLLIQTVLSKVFGGK